MLPDSELVLCTLSLNTPVASHSFCFFNDTPPTEIYTLSLHDALPIYVDDPPAASLLDHLPSGKLRAEERDRKSTRLNSSHTVISYAVFCLKKKTKNNGYHFEFASSCRGDFRNTAVAYKDRGCGYTTER